jgi:hypothetical protein
VALIFIQSALGGSLAGIIPRQVQDEMHAKRNNVGVMHVLVPDLDLNPYLVHGTSHCKCSQTILMGKTRHHILLPRLRHVHYTTRATTRGPKLSKTAVQATRFRTSPSKSALNTLPETVGENQDGEGGGWSFRAGKVCKNAGSAPKKSYGFLNTDAKRLSQGFHPEKRSICAGSIGTGGARRLGTEM